MAQSIGSSRESVNRALQDFKDKGAITLDGDLLQILRPKRLEAFAGRTSKT